MIGLFLGEKDLPIQILKKIERKKLDHFIIDLTKNNKFKKKKNSFFINIGKFGKILKLIKSKKCRQVIFAGNIIKPKISKLKLDFRGLFYIPRIVKASKLGDAAILKVLIKILSENKIKVIKLNTFNPELTLRKGIYTKIKPTLLEKEEMLKGIKILKKINSYNHTQALIIRDNKVISQETRKGTKEMIKSIAKSKIKKGILIKLPKAKQDLRVDLPTIGIDTFKDCNKVGIKGVVVKSNQNIILNKEISIKYANQNKLFLIAI
ncbi:UDP-2,3-diacylglucosamine diphosphatase LpxI [Pelagibacterales bacterium SAG-MED17]|nr:UDP-2,3-diacylglucosamine diphosphatase LpxI [Pelagibacterales bacterium SAG-MED17]